MKSDAVVSANGVGKRRAKAVNAVKLSTTAEAATTPAAIEFEPMNIDLGKLMKNEQLGAFMPNVRVAAVVLRMTKAKVISMCREEGDQLLSEGSTIGIMLDDLGAAKKQFSGFAEMCAAAEARILIACSALADEKSASEALRGVH
jgi:hypothetical protein